ncbi:MAG TPA: ParA family protein [Anaerolineales bacterium]|nr:ParA family protein [Anaerolineales bacterium]
MTRTYALVNQKGGVGKTTTAINLGACLAEAGQRVLLVDLDPQANATSCLGIRHNELTIGAYPTLIGRSRAEDNILHNTRLRLSLLPSGSALAGAQIELVDMPEREHRLRRALDPVLPHYDYVLIDCPPSLGLLTLNALLAARQGVLVPVQCEYLALEGLTSLMATFKRVRSGLFPELKLRGLILTMFDSRTHLSRDVVREVFAHFPGQVFRTIIPRSVRLAEAPSHGLPISAYDPSSPAAQAYQALARELMTGDGVPLASPAAAMESQG